MRQAMLWFALQLAISAAILFSFNYFAIWIGLASLSLVALYPLAKRVTSGRSSCSAWRSTGERCSDGPP